MDYRKFLILLSILLVLPIARADGCGIVCPKGANDLLTFSLATLCNFFTWGFCHIFSFIIVAITGIVIFVFWRKQPDEKKKTIKLFLYGLFGIFVLIIMYPYIKAWTGMAVSTPVDSCIDYSTTICDATIGMSHIPYDPTNYWKYSCSGCTASATGPGTVDFYKDEIFYTSIHQWDDNIYTLEVTELNGTSYSITCSCTPD
jgi:hypothetical protein